MKGLLFRFGRVAVVLGLMAVWRAAAAAEPFDPLADVAAELGEPVTITAVIERGRDGGPDVLAVTAALEEGWHLYSITQQPGGPQQTKLSAADDSPRRPAGPFAADPLPSVRMVDDVPSWKGLPIEEHAGRVTWRAPLAAGAGEVRGAVRLQLCQDTSCLPPRTIPFVAPAADGPAPAAAAVTANHRPERSHVGLEAGFGEPRRVGSTTAWPLSIRMVPDAGWHLYRPAASDRTELGQGKPTILAVATGAASVTSVTVTRAIAVTEGELAAAGAVEGPVALEVLVSAPGESQAVELVLGFQTCSETSCDPPTAVRLSAVPPAGPQPARLEFSGAKYGEASRTPLAIGFAAAEGERPPAPAAVGEAVTPAVAEGVVRSLPLALLMGLAGGLILNLMPCVLPVLGLKLMSFAQQSGRARREVFQLNLWYCAGLFAVFFLLATASVAANIGLASSNLGWGQQFGSVPFKIGMLGVVFAFALSFLGVWELPIPGFIGEKAGHVQSREGPTGAFLKGVLSTVLATPCSGPFLGPVFGYTLTQPTAITYAVFGSIALGMSLPYIAVGLFPGLVRFLPKPGPWMATFKEVLGFVMLGTVAYLFYLLRQQPDWFVPTFVMLVGIWLGCWWVGRAQERGGVIGFGRWLQAAVLGTVVAATGFLWLGPHDSLIKWEKPFSESRLAELRRGGSTVMVDFSADWCLTCKANLQFAIETPRVAAAIERNRVVPILADWTDGSEEIRRALERLGSRSIPLLAIYPPARAGAALPDPIILRDLLTETRVLAALEQAGASVTPAGDIRSATAAAAGGR